MRTTPYITSPTQAVAHSVSHDEIVHVVCDDRAAAIDYRRALLDLPEINDYTESEETECYGDTARVHVSVRDSGA